MDQENSAILAIIKSFEISMHGEKRYDIEWLNRILHDDFLEIGKSGYIYTKKIVVESLKEEINIISQIFQKILICRFWIKILCCLPINLMK
ncbi:hypothetical protein Xsto_03386 [Xenorhabdus stockiae]|uniref:DUF4440 domain-containing protein n=1 Tax=Xenorhabdus stockiae TaxID=351614 RepID=A0A2D0KKT9_9GAMM|nr:nuclear transport factor 2 family protein [Xenorhabdus stockiae]PHM64050.1 hypothetical protein Xsto_03386 [Xenorhabdus stockiae]